MVSNCGHKTTVPRSKFVENEGVIVNLMAQQVPLRRGSNQEGKASKSVNLEISKEAEQKR
jgi:hypothetical protein